MLKTVDVMLVLRKMGFLFLTFIVGHGLVFNLVVALPINSLEERGSRYLIDVETLKRDGEELYIVGKVTKVREGVNFEANQDASPFGRVAGAAQIFTNKIREARKDFMNTVMSSFKVSVLNESSGEPFDFELRVTTSENKKELTPKPSDTIKSQEGVTDPASIKMDHVNNFGKVIGAMIKQAAAQLSNKDTNKAKTETSGQESKNNLDDKSKISNIDQVEVKNETVVNEEIVKSEESKIFLEAKQTHVDNVSFGGGDTVIADESADQTETKNDVVLGEAEPSIAPVVDKNETAPATTVVGEPSKVPSKTITDENVDQNKAIETIEHPATWLGQNNSFAVGRVKEESITSNANQAEPISHTNTRESRTQIDESKATSNVEHTQINNDHATAEDTVVIEKPTVALEVNQSGTTSVVKKEGSVAESKDFSQGYQTETTNDTVITTKDEMIIVAAINQTSEASGNPTTVPLLVESPVGTTGIEANNGALTKEETSVIRQPGTVSEAQQPETTTNTTVVEADGPKASSQVEGGEKTNGTSTGGETFMLNQLRQNQTQTDTDLGKDTKIFEHFENATAEKDKVTIEGSMIEPNVDRKETATPVVIDEKPKDKMEENMNRDGTEQAQGSPNQDVKDLSGTPLLFKKPEDVEDASEFVRIEVEKHLKDIGLSALLSRTKESVSAQLEEELSEDFKKSQVSAGDPSTINKLVEGIVGSIMDKIKSSAQP